MSRLLEKNPALSMVFLSGVEHEGVVGFVIATNKLFNITNKTKEISKIDSPKTLLLTFILFLLLQISPRKIKKSISSGGIS
jgi:hypothetical protein